MPIFISYSHKDKEFVDSLAVQLVRRNVNVWLDRWELSVGDSLIEKVQEAVDGASALLVILSKSSVASEWCKKELSAGLLRELEERRVVVMPVMLEDCDVPVFARGKMFADFRTSFDVGFNSIVEAVAKVTNSSLARLKEPEYHVDWSIDWGDVRGNKAINLNFIQIPTSQPYSCLVNIEIIANDKASALFSKHQKGTGIEHAKLHVLSVLSEYLLKSDGLKVVLSDEKEHVRKFVLPGSASSEQYAVRLGVRRMGEDTGRDILVYVGGLVSSASRHMHSVLHKPKSV